MKNPDNKRLSGGREGKKRDFRKKNNPREGECSCSVKEAEGNRQRK